MSAAWGNLAVVALVFLLTAPGFSADASLETVTDLRIPARAAQRQQLPLLLVVTRNGCTFCEVLRAKVLRPMLISGEADDLVVLRELNMDDPRQIHDFQGAETTAGVWAAAQGITVTPTVLLLDENGRELSKRLVGISNADMYGYYLEQEIQHATEALHNSAQEAETTL